MAPLKHRSMSRASALGIGLWLGTVGPAVAPALAEPTGGCHWPSFRQAVRNGDAFAVMEVERSTGRSIRLHTSQVLRGDVPSVIRRDELYPAHLPGDEECVPIPFLPGTGDRLAVAVSERTDRITGQISAVAVIDGALNRPDHPGIERISLVRLRHLATLPPTDSMPGETGDALSALEEAIRSIWQMMLRWPFRSD